MDQIIRDVQTSAQMIKKMAVKGEIIVMHNLNFHKHLNSLLANINNYISKMPQVSEKMTQTECDDVLEHMTCVSLATQTESDPINDSNVNTKYSKFTQYQPVKKKRRRDMSNENHTETADRLQSYDLDSDNSPPRVIGRIFKVAPFVQANVCGDSNFEECDSEAANIVKPPSFLRSPTFSNKEIDLGSSSSCEFISMQVIPIPECESSSSGVEEIKIENVEIGTPAVGSNIYAEKSVGQANFQKLMAESCDEEHSKVECSTAYVYRNTDTSLSTVNKCNNKQNIKKSKHDFADLDEMSAGPEFKLRRKVLPEDELKLNQRKMRKFPKKQTFPVESLQ